MPACGEVHLILDQRINVINVDKLDSIPFRCRTSSIPYQFDSLPVSPIARGDTCTISRPPRKYLAKWYNFRLNHSPPSPLPNQNGLEMVEPISYPENHLDIHLWTCTYCIPMYKVSETIMFKLSRQFYLAAS